jgi:hypothetical protein
MSNALAGCENAYERAIESLSYVRRAVLQGNQQALTLSSREPPPWESFPVDVAARELQGSATN